MLGRILIFISHVNKKMNRAEDAVAKREAELARKKENQQLYEQEMAGKTALFLSKANCYSSGCLKA